jgi:hypothetical protein
MKYFKYFIREQEEYLSPKPKAQARPVSRIFTLGSNMRGSFPHENHPLAKMARFIQKNLPYSYESGSAFLHANSDNNMGLNLRKFVADKLDFHLSTPERFENLLNAVDNAVLVKEGSYLPSDKYVSVPSVMYHLVYNVPFAGAYASNSNYLDLTKDMSQDDIMKADDYYKKTKDPSSPEYREMMNMFSNIIGHAGRVLRTNEIKRHLGHFNEIEHFDLPEKPIEDVHDLVYKYHPVWINRMDNQEQQDTPNQ